MCIRDSSAFGYTFPMNTINESTPKNRITKKSLLWLAAILAAIIIAALFTANWLLFSSNRPFHRVVEEVVWTNPPLEEIPSDYDVIVEMCIRDRSRELFANGAVKAAAFMLDKGPGTYNMDDLVTALSK